MPRPSQSPAKRRPNQQAVYSPKAEEPAPVENQEGDYSALFNEIDVDGSGEIDIDELFECVSGLFPNAKISMRDVQNMLNEADTNGDGKISVDEFQAVLQNAEGKNTLWGKTQANIWNQFSKGLDETIAVAESASAPLKNIARNNSYLNADGQLVASGGLRCFAFGTSTLILSLVLSLMGAIYSIYFFYLCRKLNDDVESTTNSFFSNTSNVNEELYNFAFKTEAEQAAQLEEVQKKIEAGLADAVSTLLWSVLWFLFSLSAVPLLLNLWCFRKSQNFSQWWYGIKMVNKDGNDLSFIEMVIGNLPGVAQYLCFMCIIMIFSKDIIFWFTVIVDWGLLKLSVLFLVDTLTMMCMGRSVIEMVLGYQAVIVEPRVKRD